MKQIYVCLLTALGLCMGQACAQRDGSHILGSDGERFSLVEGWGVDNLEHVYVNNCNGLVIDGEQRLFMLVDDPRNNVVIFDRQGTLMKTWTLDLKSPHGLSILREGDREVLFITENGGTGIVLKTTLDGEVLMEVPYPGHTDHYASRDEYRPSDVLNAPNGDFYVLDGYGKSYIIQYNKDGEFVRIFGGDIGEGDAQLAKYGPHGGVVDTRDPENPVLVIACSDQNHLKRFTLEGEYIDTIKMPGANPREIFIFQDKLYIPHLGSDWPAQRDAPGYVSVLDKDYKVISNIGGTSPHYKDGTLERMTHDGDTFIHPHAVTMDVEGNLYVAQWNSQKTWPLKFLRVHGE